MHQAQYLYLISFRNGENLQNLKIVKPSDSFLLSLFMIINGIYATTICNIPKGPEYDKNINAILICREKFYL